MAATMTRKQMEAELRRTGGVMMIGRRLVSAENLPSEEELAKGDPEREAQVRRDLQNQLDGIQARMRTLHQESPAGESHGRRIPDEDARKILEEMDKLRSENERLRNEKAQMGPRTVGTGDVDPKGLREESLADLGKIEANIPGTAGTLDQPPAAAQAPPSPSPTQHQAPNVQTSGVAHQTKKK